VTTLVRDRRGRTLPAATVAAPSQNHVLLVVLSVAGTAALISGILMLEFSEIGASFPNAIAGTASQLHRTAIPLVVVLVAAAGNVAMGACVARMYLGRPFSSLSAFALTGLAVAVLIDTAALMLLGSLRAFVQPAVLAIHVAIFAVAWRWHRPLLALAPRDEARIPRLAYLLPALVWAAPVVLQLASPVVPFMDVLFNHVAPVEHIRTFGSFETLTTSPSPNFGPSRTLFGYVAMQGTIATAVQLPAALSVAAFALPLVLLTAAAVRRLAAALFGPGVAFWSLVTIPLTFVFLRIPDARATALVFPLAAWALTLLVAPPDGTRRQRQLLVATALAASLYVHPFIAGLMVLTMGLMVLIWPIRFARVGGPAVVGAFLLALPQAAATLGIAAPAWVGLAALPVAVAGAWVVDRWIGHVVRLGRLALVAGGLGALFIASDVVRFATEAIRDMASPFPLLTIAAVTGAMAFGRPGSGWRIVGVGLAVGILTMTGARLLPADSSLVQSLQAEAHPKALAYWGPFLLAIAAAAACHRASTLRPMPWLGQVAVLIFVLLAVLPLRLAPATVGIDNYEEHRMAESVSIAMHHAQQGYWLYYPDSRELVDASQMELFDRLDEERAQGRIGPTTQLLHAAEGFRPWVGTPVAVFTGIYESTASYDPERSIHTDGGRLYALDEFPRLLRRGYAYVLVEGQELTDLLRPGVEAAGYNLIFANGRGELFRHASLGGSAGSTSP
jgi:hypothetical protein